METHKKNRTILQLIPVLFAFFVMGFVDVVGISTSYVNNDFCMNDKLANLLLMMVFLWFAICSILSIYDNRSSDGYAGIIFFSRTLLR